MKLAFAASTVALGISFLIGRKSGLSDGWEDGRREGVREREIAQAVKEFEREQRGRG